MKKSWYDYLWIASLMYLVLGFFSDSICMAGTVMLFYSADHCNCEGEQGVLQSLLRKRTAV